MQSNVGQAVPELTLGDLLRDIGQARRYVLSGLLIGLLAGVLFMALAVPHYRASMLVAPTTRSGTPDIAALFPNNASFAMEYLLQSFGPGDSTDFMRFENILREPTIAGLLLQNEEIKRGVSADRSFRLQESTEIDTAEKLAAYLVDTVTIEPVGSTNLRRIVYLHPDRDFAMYLLNSLYHMTDSLLRDEIMTKTERRIAYLEKEIDRISHPDHKEALVSLLMDQEQIRMILAVNEPFSAYIAEPASVTPKPYWPRKTLFIPAFAFAGFFLGYALYSLRKQA